MQILNLLKGRRTYVIALLGAIAFFLYKIGAVPKEVFDWVMGLGAPAGLMALRAGLGR